MVAIPAVAAFVSTPRLTRACMVPTASTRSSSLSRTLLSSIRNRSNVSAVSATNCRIPSWPTYTPETGARNGLKITCRIGQLERTGQIAPVERIHSRSHAVTFSCDIAYPERPIAEIACSGRGTP